MSKFLSPFCDRLRKHRSRSRSPGPSNMDPQMHTKQDKRGSSVDSQMRTKKDERGDVDVSIYLDAPPAYAPEEVGRNVEVIKPAGMATDANDSDSEGLTADEMLVFLLEIDTGFLVDDSRSMSRFHSEHVKDPVTGQDKSVTRWDMAQDALLSLAEKVRPYDTDGIDIYFLNHLHNPSQHCKLKTREDVCTAFEQVTPRGRTPIPRRLRDILEPRIRAYEEFVEFSTTRTSPVLPEETSPEKPKPYNLVIITDGESDDPRLVDELIDEYKRRLKDASKTLSTVRGPEAINVNHGPSRQIGLQFLQIGTDESCKRWLQTLDNDASRDRFDIVDHTISDSCGALSEETLVKALIGGISGAYDRKPTRSMISDIQRRRAAS